MTWAPGAGSQTFPCVPVPAPIPDDDPVGVTLRCAVSGLTSAVGALQVTMTLNPAHTFTGDLDAHLAPPGVNPGDVGSFLLFDALDSPVDNAVMAGPYTFVDTAATNFIAAALAAGPAVIPTGSYRTTTESSTVNTSLNEALGGLPARLANGMWQLRMRDLAADDVGTIAAASVTIVGPTVAASVLPTSRSVKVPGGNASAFATIINLGATTATNCRLSPRTAVGGTFIYQTTNAQNQLVGAPNTPVDIPAGALQPFFLAFMPPPFENFGPTDVQINFVCDQSAAAIVTGLTTLLLSASTSPVPDIVALAATPNNNGIVDIPGPTGSGAFAVATVNVGAGASITTSADTGSVNLPVHLFVCQTDPAAGKCFAPPAPTVTTQIDGNATPTFAIFVQGSASVPFDPANNRVFVRFKDAGGVTRGATSVAVRTQ
jgi:subtilisin-like proprotein convertase family protein